MTATRGRGWLAVGALALTTAVLSVLQPALLIFVPLALLFVALPPRRPLLLALAGFIGWLVFGGTPGSSIVWYFERGWALLLGAWFVVAIVLAPQWRFLSRALTALAATVATTALLFGLNGSAFESFDTAVGDQLRSGATTALALWSQTAGVERVSDDVRRAVLTAADYQARLYPALLALASLAALGVAWWAFSRLAREDAQPLRPLREFRFRDELVWLLIAGLLLLVLPLNELATRAGGNILTFMAALYALRGAAVLLVMAGAPGPLAMIVGAVLLVFLYPLVMVTTFVVGLSDTWLDIRARRAVPDAPGS